MTARRWYGPRVTGSRDSVLGTPLIRRRRFARRGQVRIGLAGVGYWGPNLLRNACEIEDIDVLAVCDLDQSALERQGRRYPRLARTREFDDLLDAAIDAVVIATPIATHFELARRALQAGKHVLVEKPLAATVAEAEELRRLAHLHDLVVMPGHTFLYSPPVVAIKRLLDEGELGRMHFATSSRVNLGIHQRDISVVRDLAPHDFSILAYWMGHADFVRAIGRDVIVEGIVDVAFIDAGYADGCLAHIDVSWLAPTKLRRTVLVGARKMVVYEDTSPEQVRVYDRRVERIEPETFGEFQLSYRAGDIVTPHLAVAEPLRVELEDFAAAIRAGSQPRSHIDLGIEVVQMVQAAEESLATGGGPVTVASGSAPSDDHLSDATR
jgi:predicted dehydrogenase